ncbi:hypothetical protein D9611_002220 [Ephemerocybe angulata]|uniref:Peptidase S54 rhomboid domain-containing protein n=1 Tax=Ephemerocybe angulata TaxID=980116 RepID=A0A8H5C2M1_9AGAR|nr:hypothetical protein D9611_002220 [Tulosesus angulatus]
MASVFLNIGLRRSLAGLRQSPVVRCSHARTLMTQRLSFRLPESRVLNLFKQRGGIKFPAPQPTPRTFFTSPKQSVRYPAQPQRPQRSQPFLGFLNNLNHNAIIYGIIGLNVGVFGMWYLTQSKYKLEGDARPLIWMYQNFTNSWGNLRAGRVWTAITSCFSHKDFSHILFNGFTFYFMAPVVLQILGGRRFIFLYMGAGLVSAATSLLYGRYIDRKDVPSHGASGAIMGTMSFLACVAPTMTFQLYGIIPVPAWLVVTALFGYDAYSTYTDNRGTTDTVGHIGGVLAGVAYWVILRRAPRY